MKYLIGSMAVIVALALLFVLSLVSAGLWYCFDDWLAQATGAEWVGRVPFWNMYALTLFIGSVFRASAYSSSSK